MSEEIKDEYQISKILKIHNIENASLLKDIDDHLNKTLTIYLMGESQQRDAVHKEWLCFLMTAIIDTRDGSKSDLADRIKMLIEEGNKAIDKEG